MTERDDPKVCGIDDLLRALPKQTRLIANQGKKPGRLRRNDRAFFYEAV